MVKFSVYDVNNDVLFFLLILLFIVFIFLFSRIIVWWRFCLFICVFFNWFMIYGEEWRYFFSSEGELNFLINRLNMLFWLMFIFIFNMCSVVNVFFSFCYCIDFVGVIIVWLVYFCGSRKDRSNFMYVKVKMVVRIWCFVCYNIFIRLNKLILWLLVGGSE